MNIISSQELITTRIKECITSEMTPEGLLSDVETFIPSYRMEEEMEEPLIWLFEHPTTIANEKSGALSQKLYLQTPYEFVCVVYDEDDIEESEMKGKNLASRVAASIAKNHIKLNSDRIISKIEFETLYPVGEVSIRNKSDKAPATSVRIIAKYYIDWMNCCKRKIENNNDNNDNDGD
ncbi:MAG: hypothetical protein E7Z73_07870 [Methanobrevibacter millerae]|uniref:Uncharacterized protein n=1 Tax=Methanobrevibacter millerae TaxID=230361 RepID=A0A8T3VCC6_9EURY|nr:hypothetical protein [Methanobrevibacter millerae]MBE6505638.1 hypothetical protein [Methanobrevibacter millerae]